MSDKKRSEEDKAFEQGVLWAASYLCQAHDRPTMAQEMINEAGAKVKNADEYDRDILKKAGVK